MTTRFKDLQREWYSKLAASGFVDIEAKSWDRDSSDALWSSRAYRSKVADIGVGPVALAVESYFGGLSLAIDNEYADMHPRLMSPRKRIMLEVLKMHAAGISTRSICRELQRSGLRPNRRNTINAWIKQFVSAVGLRHYTPEAMRNL